MRAIAGQVQAPKRPPPVVGAKRPPPIAGVEPPPPKKAPPIPGMAAESSSAEGAAGLARPRRWPGGRHAD